MPKSHTAASSGSGAPTIGGGRFRSKMDRRRASARSAPWELVSVRRLLHSPKEKAKASGKLRFATARYVPPSNRASKPNAASQRCIAFSSIASNTGPRSPGDELMTCKTSAVAVCWSSASSRSAVRSSSLRRRSAMICQGSSPCRRAPGSSAHSLGPCSERHETLLNTRLRQRAVLHSDHLVGAGDLLSRRYPAALSPASSSTGKPTTGSRVGSQFLGDRGLGCRRIHAHGASGKPWSRMIDGDEYRTRCGHRGRRPGESPGRGSVSEPQKTAPLRCRRGMDDAHDDLPLPVSTVRPQPSRPHRL